MLRFLKPIIASLFVIFALNVFADTTNPFPIKKDPPPTGGTGSGGGTFVGGGGEGDDEDEGHRAPARPVFCTIDFAAGEVAITGYDVADIETFEIWDADRTFCIASAAECADFVADLAETSGTVAVVFYFDGFTLSGYFTR